MSVLNFAMRSRFNFHRQIEDEILGNGVESNKSKFSFTKKSSFICDTCGINDTKNRIGEKQTRSIQAILSDYFSDRSN